ncbi:MAG: hypothetical protein ACI86H_002459 [bacterium]
MSKENIYEADHLVLGAWGCGVFQNKAEDIAGYFSQHFQANFQGCFEKVVFAILNHKNNFSEFQKYFV